MTCSSNELVSVLERHGVPFIALPGVEWTVYKFQSPLLKLNAIFPEGIQIPKMYVGKNVCHLPTVKVHGHTTTTGAIKNAFGGILKEVRQYAHEYIHEVMVELMYMQRELHPGTFAVMDGTVVGDGAGPRTMIPREGNLNRHPPLNGIGGGLFYPSNPSPKTVVERGDQLRRRRLHLSPRSPSRPARPPFRTLPTSLPIRGCSSRVPEESALSAYRSGCAATASRRPLIRTLAQ